RKAKAPRLNGKGMSWQSAPNTRKEAQTGKHHRAAVHAAQSPGLAIGPSKGPVTTARIALRTRGRSRICSQPVRQPNSTSAINAANKPPATKAWTRVKLFPKGDIFINGETHSRRAADVEHGTECSSRRRVESCGWAECSSHTQQRNGGQAQRQRGGQEREDGDNLLKFDVCSRVDAVGPEV